jgi:kinesin family protein 2/24
MQQQEAVPPVSAEMAGQPLLSSEKLPDSAELSQLKAMNAQSSEGPRVRNQDKRTSRIQNRDSFIGAIEAKRETMAAAPAPSAPDEGVAARGIHVCVRKRPIFPHEDAAGDYDTTTVSGRRMAVHDGRMKPDMVHMEMKHTTYTFPRVFDENDTNDTVYESAAGPLVRHAAQGGTATMFMFGQTGSGKTYTMTAIHERAVQELFEQLDGSEAVLVSYVELAGSACRDLLNGGGAVDLMSDKHGEVQLRGLTELEAHDHVELLDIMTAANNARATSATGVHDQSSRSHAVCRVTIQRQGRGANGMLTMVDLAGSERSKDSMYHDAQTQKETSDINASLMALKECVRALSMKSAHVNYRANSLTQVLRSCFTDRNACTVVRASSLKQTVASSSPPAAVKTRPIIFTKTA